MSDEQLTGQSAERWSEDDSAAFIDTADLFVPARAEQVATLRGLIPAGADDEFTIVELASGDGTLAQTLLEAFPRCHYVALDVSEVMRDHLLQRLASFGERIEARHFELAEREWRDALPSPLRCVVSSLSVHHLTGDEKRVLFADMAARLEPGGALLLADIVEPISPRVAALYARQYDNIVREQSFLAGKPEGYKRFQEMRWNYFAYDYGDSATYTYDFPSPLSEQLLWLREAGFSSVDCFWLRAGHAIYGGYR
ncbi:MAG: class I SAM-dependent methyltransferase [Ktedonobacterales bacterium]